MTYLIALLCPPLALAMIGRPVRAILATMLLGLAAATWTAGPGIVIAALTILWACRVVGDNRAKRELDGFLEVFNEAQVQHR
jgi:uncharacterized membrane protein YdjX (TVP38/TMEM64 family)